MSPSIPAACKAACKVHLEWVVRTHRHQPAGAGEDTRQKLVLAADLGLPASEMRVL